MNSIYWRSRLQGCCNPWLCILALTLLAACRPTPSVTAPTVPPPTAIPPTALPATPTQLPPTAIPPTPPTPAAPAAPAAPTQNAAPPADTGIPASAGYLVYQRPDGSLWRAEGTGQPPSKLTEPTDPAALLPWAAAPDGKTIAVVLGTGLWSEIRENPTLALWLVASDGSNLRKIQDLLPARRIDPTPGGGGAFDLLPALTDHQELAWSPDGQLIAFVSAHQDQVDLYTAALDGSITRLTDTARLEQGPRWSPDGALLAYRTNSGFGTGAGWSDIALETTSRAGGPSTVMMGEQALSAGGTAVAVPDLLWAGPTTIVAGIADAVVGKAEVRTLEIGTRASTLIFDAPYSALDWNDTTRQLAIAGTSEAILQAKTDARKLAPGLFTWSPDAGPPIQIEHAPVEVLTWTPQGDALAYSAGGEQPELRLWAIGAEGDLKPLATQPAKQLRWSLDGQQLATDTAIYSRAGQLMSDRSNDQLARLIDWGPQGLFFATTDGNNQDLWLWDGPVPPQQIDSQLTTTQSAGVVLARP